MIEIPKTILRATGRAIGEYRMIQANDRLLLGLSGGKDSLSLLHILLHLQKKAPLHFDLATATVDPLSAEFDPAPLKPYVESLGLQHFWLREPIVELAKIHMGKPSYCAFCARMRRGLLYKTAREQGFNVIVLAQHLDDIVESFYLSLWYGGKLHTMKGHYRIDAGDLRVIRPLLAVRERQLRNFAQRAQLPVIVDNCPACFAAPSERQKIKLWLAEQERQQPRIFANLGQALTPLIMKGLPEFIN